MYGLINSALQSMVREKFGDEEWGKVLATSGVSEDSFLAMRSYDDEVTYALVGAASEVLGEPASVCLEMFGEYWLLETATKSYGPLLDAAGESIIEFLRNLNGLHDRLTGTFLEYVPPEFHIRPLGGDMYAIDYISQREGLTPFVVGLLKGMAIRFDSSMEIQGQCSMDVESGEHTVFEVIIRC